MDDDTNYTEWHVLLIAGMFVSVYNHLTFTGPLYWSGNPDSNRFGHPMAVVLFVSVFPMLFMISNLSSYLWWHYHHDTDMPKYWFYTPSCCDCLDNYPRLESFRSNFDDHSFKLCVILSIYLPLIFMLMVVFSPGFILF